LASPPQQANKIVETPAKPTTTSQIYEFYQLPAKYKRKIIQNDEIDFINVNFY
jgi:hypothetical protein